MANYVQEYYTANLGFANFTASANSNLDGSTGSYFTVLTAGGDGTFVKSLIIKSLGATTEGMIRVFAKRSGLTNNLLAEYYIPPVTPSGRDICYQYVIPLNYTLQTGEEIKVSSETNDTFNIIAEGLDIANSTSAAFLASSMEFIPNAGSGTVSVANSNTDGSTGTYATIYTAAAAAGGFKGSVISSMIVKAQQTTTPGMIRFFILDTSGLTPGVLFHEVEVPAITQGAALKTFSFNALAGSLCIPAGYSIIVSTENNEYFSIIIEGSDWKYV